MAWTIYDANGVEKNGGGTGSSYYQTVQDEGVGLAQQPVLDFQGSGVTATNGTGKTVVTIPGGTTNGYQTVQEEGSALTQRSALNFTSPALTASDNAGSSRTDVTVGTGNPTINTALRGDGAWATDIPLDLTNTQAGNYTLVLSDGGKVISMTSASANQLSIPTDASANFPLGTEVTVRQQGAGQTTIAAVTPGTTTVRSRGSVFTLSGQYAYATLVKVAANTWELTGDLTSSGGTSYYQTVQDEGSALAQQPTLNFAGAGVTATNDSANSRTLVTIPGGSGGYGTVQDEGSALTARAIMNFVGSGVTATDDAANSRTLVTIAAGAADGGPATLVVAASDAPAAVKAGADYQCDGTADQTEINTALAAGLSVTLTEGTFQTTGPINITRGGTTLSGSGWGTFIRMQSGFSGALVANATESAAIMVDSQNSSNMLGNCIVKDLYIDGNNIGTAGGTVFNGINFACSMGQIRHVFVASTSNYGIVIYGRTTPYWTPFDTIVEHCIARWTWQSGFVCGINGADLLFTSCKPIACGNPVDFGSGIPPQTALTTTVNGAQAYTTGTLTVASTTGFPSVGWLYIGGQRLNYSGKTATTFTSVTPWSGTLANGTSVQSFEVRNTLAGTVTFPLSAGTVSLTNASGFATSGTVWIGPAGTQQIKVTYTGKTGNNLTGATAVGTRGPGDAAPTSGSFAAGTDVFAFDLAHADGFRLDYASNQVVNSHPYGCMGAGFRFGRAAVQQKISNCKIEGNRHGVITEEGSTSNIIVGCNFRVGWDINTSIHVDMRNNLFGNGQATGGAGIVACLFTAENDSNVPSTLYAIRMDYNAQTNLIALNRFGGGWGGGGPLNYPVSPGTATLRSQFFGNTGLVTENSGTSAMPAAVGSVTVTHGLAFTPSREEIALTPLADVGPASGTTPVRYYVSATSASNFTITYAGGTPISGNLMGWHVSRLGIR